MNDYTTTITVDATPAQAYDAINDVRNWWTRDIEGSTDTLGEEFVFRGEDVHYSRIKVIEMAPGERVEWLVLDNHMTFVQDQSEWVDTHITFDISISAGGTDIRFSHVGLVPAYECFDQCSNAWAFFINDSLRALLTAGEGKPMPKKEHGSPLG